MSAVRSSRSVRVPCGVSSFFEILDSVTEDARPEELLRVGATGGGFIIARGTTTKATPAQPGESDSVRINLVPAPQAITSLTVIKLMRRKFDLPPIRARHVVEPPVGQGFGTSGSGALGLAIAISDLFDLNLSLVQASAYAHTAEIECVTGLGTVASLASGAGAIGLVTEPGSFGFGRVDSILDDYDKYVLVCACFGPIEKSSVLKNPQKRHNVNEHGRRVLESIMKKPTVASLLIFAREFAEKGGIASPELLNLADAAVELGAIGATQNMIGNALHCLVPKQDRAEFIQLFARLVPSSAIFESDLYHGGPKILSS